MEQTRVSARPQRQFKGGSGPDVGDVNNGSVGQKQCAALQRVTGDPVRGAESLVNLGTDVDSGQGLDGAARRNAAGDDGEAIHYQGAYSPVTGSSTDGKAGAHNFGDGSDLLVFDIPAGGAVNVDLPWSTAWGQSTDSDDLDLYLYEWNGSWGTPVKKSETRINYGQFGDPVESLSYENILGETVQVAVQVVFTWPGTYPSPAVTLEIFATAFCLRNSFHCNGDQSGKGYSRFTYRPFTLEGNFAAAAGLQEMLLQSHRGVIRVFPAVPDQWREVLFSTLRAQGAFLVSAQRSEGQTRWVEIRAEQAGVCRVVSPFTGETLALPFQAGQTRRLTAEVAEP